MVQKPIIGITSNLDNLNFSLGRSEEFVFVRVKYVSIILEHGGIPLVINSKTSPEDAESLISRLDGLLLIGGQDIDPKFYGEDCHIKYTNMKGSGTPYNRPLYDKPNPERDRFEIALYQAAKKRKLPVIGICRGYQLINVAEGGSLFQEIAVEDVSHSLLPSGHIPDHEINIHENSHAHEVFGSTCFITYSIHHQGIKRLGNDLIATGFATDGLIEVIESKDFEHFMIGVQGHPELSGRDHNEHSNLFASFVAACIDNSKLNSR